MIDLQPHAAQTEQHSPEVLPERLPWVSPRLDSIKFKDAQNGTPAGGDAGTSHS
jgi:hypothetical protein